MTPQQIVGLGVRLLAIWLAVTSVSYLIAMPSAIEKANLGSGAIVSYLIGALYLLAALLLWLFPMSVAHKLVARTNFDNRLNVPAVEAARVGCCLLGLWILSRTVPYFVSFFFRAYLISGSGSYFNSLTQDAKVDLVSVLVELLIAIALITASGNLARRMTASAGVQ